MFCILMVVRVQVLFSNSGSVHVFYCSSARVRVLYCNGGKFICFVL